MTKYKQVPKIEHNSVEDELLFLQQMMHDCHTFLQKWKVMLGNRTETIEDAFVAITELEKEVREARDALVKTIGVDVVPF